MSRLSASERREQERLESDLNNARSFRQWGEPTYYFEVGDSVICGNWEYPVIEEVLDGGYIYKVSYTDRDGNFVITYRVWHDLRPVISENTKFYKKTVQDLHFYNMTIDSLILRFYKSGIIMNPDYQRNFVWSLEEKRSLIRSIFNGYDIGKFVLYKLNDIEWKDTNYQHSYEIIDGKQRLAAILDFYEDRFDYEGYYYSQLSNRDKHVIMDATAPQAIVERVSEKQKIEIFYFINSTGVTMDKNHLEKVKRKYRLG